MLSAPARIGFLGLGIMGAGMARRLIGAGHRVSVYNRNPARTAGFAEAGAIVTATPADAARGAAVVISMVADDTAARAVWLGPDGALAATIPGAIVIESSTVSVGWVRELAAATAARGGEFLDAPVTGSRVQAAAGELNFLVGGAPATLERVRSILAAMSRTIVPLGPVGSGAMMKLVNNFLCGVQTAALAEAIAMIERTGLDREAAIAVVTGGAPGSPLVKGVSARMTAPEAAPHFHLRLMGKDLAYAIAEAERHGLTLATGVAARAAFDRGVGAGLGEKDIAAVIEPLRHG